MLKTTTMKLTTKKIIAREFLAALLVLAIGLTTFLGIYAYNSIKEKKISRLTSEINIASKQVDSLSYSYNKKTDKQNWFFKKWSSTFDLSEDTLYNTLEKVWKRIDYLAQQDSISYRWKNIWHKDLVTFHKEIGFQNPEEFKAFIDDNRISEKDKSDFTKSIEKKAIVTELDNQIKETQKSKLSNDEQLDFTTTTILLVCLFIFGFRYLYYGVKWSIRILKEKA
jgi:hypothetical protein